MANIMQTQRNRSERHGRDETIFHADSSGSGQAKAVACYQRVSSDSQDVASQNFAIQEYIQANNLTNVVYFVDKVSGTKDSRPALDEMLARIEAGEFHTVLVFKLDRLSRKAVTAMEMLLGWIKNDIGFISVSQPILHLGHNNPFRLTFASLMAEVAALERENIVGRVKSGLAAAKARGVKLGAKPKLTQEQIAAAKALRKAGWSVRAIAEKYDVNASTICRNT